MRQRRSITIRDRGHNVNEIQWCLCGFPLDTPDIQQNMRLRLIGGFKVLDWLWIGVRVVVCRCVSVCAGCTSPIVQCDQLLMPRNSSTKLFTESIYWGNQLKTKLKQFLVFWHVVVIKNTHCLDKKTSTIIPLLPRCKSKSDKCLLFIYNLQCLTVLAYSWQVINLTGAVTICKSSLEGFRITSIWRTSLSLLSVRLQ